MATSAYGTVFKFTPQGGSQVAVGKLTSIGKVSPEAEEIDVTTLDSPGGYREYVQGYKDAGSVSLEGFHDRGDEGQEVLVAAFDSGKAGDCVIEFSGGAKATFKAYVKSYTLGSAEVDGAVGFGAQLRITGKVSYAGG